MKTRYSIAFEKMSEEAQQVAADMIEYGLSGDIRMGMDGGYDDNDNPRPFRKELEKFVKSLDI